MPAKLKSYFLSPKFYLFLILIIASFLRFYNFKNIPPGLYPDEAMNGNNALEALSTHHFKVFYPENNGREGLFINIQAIFLWLFKITEPWVLRLPSALFGILTVLGIYFLAKELFGYEIRNEYETTEWLRNTKRYETTKIKFRNFVKNSYFVENFVIRREGIALLSSFLLATSFWHINFSRIGFRAIMAPFFLVWGLYFLLKTFRQIQEKKSSKSYILNSIFSGILYGLGFYSYIAYRATPLLILIILIYFFIRSIKEGWRKQLLLSTFYFLLSTFIVALPLGIYFLKNPQDFFGRTTQISVFNSPTLIKDLGLNILKTFGMFNFVGDFNWRHNYSGRPELFWPVGILFIIGTILGLYSIFKKTNIKAQIPNQIQNSNDKSFHFLDFELDLKFGFWILFFWLIIASLPVVISNESLPHALRAILMAPAVFILAGCGGIWLYEFIKSKITTHNLIVLNFFTAFFLIILICESYLTYFVLWAKNPNVAGAFNQDWTRIGHELKATCGDGCDKLPKYVIVEAGGVDVRGIPMPAQTVMFLTDTFTLKKQNAKNLHYVLPNQKDQIPQNALVVEIK